MPEPASPTPDAPNTPPVEHSPAPAAPGPAQAVAERPAPARHPKHRDTLPPFRVLLHNDDHNSDVYVIETVMHIAAMPVGQAYQVMLEAHEKGVSLVTVCHREKAELLQEQFQSKGLTSTIEPAELSGRPHHRSIFSDPG